MNLNQGYWFGQKGGFVVSQCALFASEVCNLHFVNLFTHSTM